MADQPFCTLPWFHQVVSTDGSMKPCCMWRPGNSEYNAQNFLQGQFMQELREQFKKGIPHEECWQCTYPESVNNNSVRLDSFNTASAMKLSSFTESDVMLRSQDVNLSNVCNLKCRMCGQTRSTKWIADDVAMGKQSVGLLESNWSLSNEQVMTMERLRFPGGEPMMHQDIIVRELNKIKAVGRLHLVDLHFTTNMTVRIIPELMNLITSVKSTNICCSIDGVGEMNDYIRSDSHWCDVVKNTNILKMLHNDYPSVLFGFNPVYNVFNVEEFDKLVEWGSEYNTWIIPNLQYKPAMQDARNLPDDYKAEVIAKYERCKHNYPNYVDRFDNIIGHLSNERTVEYAMWKRQLRKHNKFLDQRRRTNLANVNPRLASIIYG